MCELYLYKTLILSREGSEMPSVSISEDLSQSPSNHIQLQYGS